MAIILFKWLWWATTLLHPYYVSVIELEQNRANQQMEMAVRVFTDDLEKSVQQSLHASVDFNNHSSQTKNNSLLHQFVQKHITVSVNGKKLNFQWVGYDIEKESIWIYLEAPVGVEAQQIAVQTNLLHNISENQINIIHATVKGERKSTKIDFPKMNAQLSW